MDLFDGRGPAAHLAERTRLQLQYGYGKFLAFLGARHPSLLTRTPAERVNRKIVEGYVKWQPVTCGGITLAIYLYHLWLTLRYICPRRLALAADHQQADSSAGETKAGEASFGDQRGAVPPRNPIDGWRSRLRQAADELAGANRLQRRPHHCTSGADPFTSADAIGAPYRQTSHKIR